MKKGYDCHTGLCLQVLEDLFFSIILFHQFAVLLKQTMYKKRFKRKVDTFFKVFFKEDS